MGLLNTRFLVAASQREVLQRCLLSSALWQDGVPPPDVVWEAASAAAAFNPVMDRLAASREAQWLVWVHQDVVLPPGWQHQWADQMRLALERWPHLAVAGVYGLWQNRPEGAAIRAGHVVDRGTVLREPAPLPHAADSLDELLVAVRVDAGLRFDPALGFDFYGTDICLQALQQGYACAVLDACCEHHSSTSRSGVMPRRLIERIARNGAAFEQKWAHRLPLCTSCFDIRQAGDVARFLAAHTVPDEAG
jgi:GT2 family glycosyltransferase